MSIHRPRRNLGIIAAIIAIAISLSLISYQYSQYSAAQIEEISIRNTRSNTEIQSYDLSNSLADKLKDITSMLQVISASPAIHEGDLSSAASIFGEAETATSELIDFYMWLDRDGRIVWLSNINQTSYEEYRGVDLSYRLYFSEAKTTQDVYYSSIVDSNDKVSRLYISYPIIEKSEPEPLTGNDPAAVIGSAAQSGDFKGAIVAAIRTDVLGNYLESRISPSMEGHVSLIDHTGIILYSKDSAYVGKNVFGTRFQSLLQSFGSDTTRTMSTGFKLGLEGYPGSEEVVFSSADGKSAFVYSPILLKGKQFGLLYIVVPYAQVAEVTALVESQKNLSILIITVIGALAITAAVVILRWNKGLEKIIAQRTIELREANERLMVHDKLQKEFINIAAHELRTPIQPILGMSELLESEFGEDREDIRMISRNAKRLERLTQDILDVSKIESGSLSLNTRTTDLDDIMSPVIIDYRNSVAANPNPNVSPDIHNAERTNVKVKYEPKNIVVEADKDRIQQVVSNLINNALKFTKENGEIIVKSEVVDKDCVQIIVQDTGSGIDPEIMPRLFQKFATKSERGTGLGLYISKNIVEAHGGRMWAENNTDGKGARFTFTLPISQKERRDSI